jgi:alpha-amylase/alpha-mannosidase (GH57 family)
MEPRTKRFICIHGHFYQPPRENPWLEEIENQPSAHPFHDWNERVTFECYTANTQARILDENGCVRAVRNNYEQISFDMGPTLLSWLEEHAQETYEAILAADALSCTQRSGHGNAIAAAYNHIIMPLASRRDKITQVIWGLEDFRKRFQRESEGMWLPETAVDRETLEILAEHGIRFVVLAPRQCSRFRTSSRSGWVPLASESVDPSRPYLCRLSRGLSITLFFYDGPISQAIAFENLLHSGEELKNRLLAAFSPARTWAQLIHIATDGESYGHHHRFGEMALAYALEKLSQDSSVALTNYGEFLEKHTATAEAEIIENSSWSCAHGVGRWSEDCGCRIAHRPDWNQKWRAPLRHAMDLLRNRVDSIFQHHAADLFAKPWDARDHYIGVILDRAGVNRFLASHATKKLSAAEKEQGIKLLEMQRNRMLMYTSCGWFFDDISGIEAMQILRYAARVVQLATPFDEKLLDHFLKELAPGASNLKPHLSGDELFRQRIYPQLAELSHVAAHVTIASVFDEAPAEASLYSYDIQIRDSVRHDSEERTMLISRLTIHSRITTERKAFVAVVTYFGGVDLRCSVDQFRGKAKYHAMKQDLSETFARLSSTELVRRLDSYFPGSYFGLRELFMDRRRDILDRVTYRMYEEQAEEMERFYKKNRSLAKLLANDEMQIPDTFLVAAEFVLNRMFSRELDKISRSVFPDQLTAVTEEMRFWSIEGDISEAERLIRERILALVKDLQSNPWDERIFSTIKSYVALSRDLDLPLDLGEAQIVFFRLLNTLSSQTEKELPLFYVNLAEMLSVRIAEQ